MMANMARRSELDQFFSDISNRIDPAVTNSPQDSSHPIVSLSEVHQFLSDVSRLLERQRRRDRRLASNFNVFDLIEPDENKLSDVLAFLLDPHGGHGQGDLFLRTLLKRLELTSDSKLTKDAVVQREAPTHGILKWRRRIDVLAEAGVLLAIENKVDSMEQSDQIRDYLKHLNHCARGGTVRSALIYLTPDGRSPESLRPSVLKWHQANRRVHCWSYLVEILAWLRDCRRKSEAERIRQFLSDFIAYIESALKRDSVNDQDEADEN
jgi:hypothetical protein